MFLRCKIGVFPQQRQKEAKLCKHLFNIRTLIYNFAPEKPVNMAELTIKQKKDFAKQLFLNDSGVTQAEVAERVGVSKVTVCKWVNEGKWDEMRTSLLVGKEMQLSWLYRQLEQWQDNVSGREDGKKILTSKDADAVLKITAAIKNLETETNTAEKIATGKEFLAFVRRTCGLDQSKEIARLFNAYIKSCF